MASVDKIIDNASSILDHALLRPDTLSESISSLMLASATLAKSAGIDEELSVSHFKEMYVLACERVEQAKRKEKQGIN